MIHINRLMSVDHYNFLMLLLFICYLFIVSMSFDRIAFIFT